MPQITYPDKAIGDLYRAVEANEVKAVVNAKMDRPNGLVSGGAITIGSHGGAGTNNDIKVTAGSYFISPDFYNFTETPNTAPWLDVALCAGGFSRYVEIVGTTTGITRRDGTPSAIPSHPTLAANEISIGWILVGDSVFEETASGGGASIISDNEFVLNKTWSSSNISKNLHTYRSIEFIATEEQDINSPIIQGITATTGELALFTAQLIPSENGEYFYHSGAGWIKTAAWFDYRANEHYYNESLFLRNTAFYALKGTEVGSLYVMNVFEPSYAFSKIGGGSGGATELSVINRDLDSLEIDSSTGVGTGAVIESATTSLAGLQSAADKTKLNLYPATATNNKYLKGNGTSWVEVDSTVTDTDELPEGTTNLYFTTARAIAALSSTLANYILTSAISNVLTVTTAGSVLDARQGKVLKDLIDALTTTVGGKVDKLTGQSTRIAVWDANGDIKGYSSLTFDTALQIINSSPELLLNRSSSLFRLYKDSFGLKASNNVLQAAGLGSAIKLTAIQTSKITPSFPTLNTSFAVSFWVKHTAATRVSVFSFVDGSNDFAFVERNLGTIQYYQLNGGGDSASFPIGTLKNGNWHHVVLSCTPSTINVYIDGVLTATKTAMSLPAARLNLNIGYCAMQYTNYYSDSWIDDFRVYNSVLSAGDVLNIYGQLPPVGKLPVLHFKFDENSGNILTDSKDGVLSPVNYTINGVVGWGVGIANAEGTSAIAQIIESKDGSYNGERGIHRFGDIFGKFVATGNQFYVEINETIYPIQIDTTGRITLDASNGDSTLGKGPITNNSLPTAKVNIGAPTTTLAGFRLFAGTENTSTQNVGDVNHSAVRRTFIKRKGTTGNTIPLADVDTLFTGGYAQIDDPTTTGSLIAINATYGGGNIIPANFLCLSKTIELDLDGTIVAGSAGNAVIAVKLGAVTIASFSVATVDTVTASPFFLKVKIQDINVAGEVMVTGRLELNAATYKMIGSNGGQASGVDKTTALTLDVTGTLTGTTTGGSIRCLISTAKILN